VSQWRHPARATTRCDFELGYYALKPDITIIAPWREMGPALARATDRLRRSAPDFRSPRTSAGEAPFLGRRQPVACLQRGQRCWKIRRTKCRITSTRAPSIRKRPPDKPTVITVDFEKGDAVAIDGNKLSPGDRCWQKLNELGPRQRHRPARSGREPLRRHESRGGMYETPGRHHPFWRRIAAIEIDHAWIAARRISRMS